MAKGEEVDTDLSDLANPDLLAELAQTHKAEEAAAAADFDPDQDDDDGDDPNAQPHESGGWVGGLLGGGGGEAGVRRMQLGTSLWAERGRGGGMALLGGR